MKNQRGVLVAYLLRRYCISELGIRDVNGVFDCFLKDAQMGHQIKTSCIEQVISVVQVFAQRTLLALEKEVNKTSLVREQWEWSQQHTLWEACMKLFLYPGNWLKPSFTGC